VNGWLTGFVIGLAPLILLVAALLAGRYPGEQALERCRRAITILFSRLRRRVLPTWLALPFPAAVRGGRLIARSLAGRGPPASIRI